MSIRDFRVRLQEQRNLTRQNPNFPVKVDQGVEETNTAWIEKYDGAVYSEVSAGPDMGAAGAKFQFNSRWTWGRRGWKTTRTHVQDADQNKNLQLKVEGDQVKITNPDAEGPAELTIKIPGANASGKTLSSDSNGEPIQSVTINTESNPRGGEVSYLTINKEVSAFDKDGALVPHEGSVPGWRRRPENWVERSPGSWRRPDGAIVMDGGLHWRHGT